jgi:hypothetical protein
MMLGYLLARAGAPVTVIEKRSGFFRYFRGDTVSRNDCRGRTVGSTTFFGIRATCRLPDS